MRDGFTKVTKFVSLEAACLRGIFQFVDWLSPYWGRYANLHFQELAGRHESNISAEWVNTHFKCFVSVVFVSKIK